MFSNWLLDVNFSPAYFITLGYSKFYIISNFDIGVYCSELSGTFMFLAILSFRVVIHRYACLSDFFNTSTFKT